MAGQAGQAGGPRWGTWGAAMSSQAHARPFPGAVHRRGPHAGHRELLLPEPGPGERHGTRPHHGHQPRHHPVSRCWPPKGLWGKRGALGGGYRHRVNRVHLPSTSLGSCGLRRPPQCHGPGEGHTLTLNEVGGWAGRVGSSAPQGGPGAVFFLSGFYIP